MLDIILMAMVAAFIFLRLRSELGKKTGDDPLPPAAGRSPYQAGSGTTIDAEAVEIDARAADVVDLVEDPAVRGGLAGIRKADRHFDIAEFLDGAKNAYGIILEAFWQGDKDTLKTFLDETVFTQFSAAIDQREADGLTLKNKLLDITKAEISDARLRGKDAEITVQYTAEVIAATVDQKGKLVDGDASDATELNDKWTFARDTSSRNPAWTLIATFAG